VTAALDDVVVIISSDQDIVRARQSGRELSVKLGFTVTDLTLIATAISEVARNITTYAGRGEIRLRAVDDGLRRGITVVASDDGPGIDNIERALQDGYSSGRGLGLGLPGARRLMDHFKIRSTPGAGTTITMSKWVARRG
jgi:serine/threonine-protein kinase RsbT